jgi:hypothetical protein
MHTKSKTLNVLHIRQNVMFICKEKPFARPLKVTSLVTSRWDQNFDAEFVFLNETSLWSKFPFSRGRRSRFRTREAKAQLMDWINEGTGLDKYVRDTQVCSGADNRILGWWPEQPLCYKKKQLKSWDKPNSIPTFFRNGVDLNIFSLYVYLNMRSCSF